MESDFKYTPFRSDYVGYGQHEVLNAHQTLLNILDIDEVKKFVDLMEGAYGADAERKVKEAEGNVSQMKKSSDDQFKVIGQIHDQNLRGQLTRAYKSATELAMLLLLLTPALLVHQQRAPNHGAQLL